MALQPIVFHWIRILSRCWLRLANRVFDETEKKAGTTEPRPHRFNEECRDIYRRSTNLPDTSNNARRERQHPKKRPAVLRRYLSLFDYDCYSGPLIAIGSLSLTTWCWRFLIGTARIDGRWERFPWNLGRPSSGWSWAGFMYFTIIKYKLRKGASLQHTKDSITT